MHQFHKFILSWNSTCYGQFLCPSSGVYSLYTQQWYMSYRFVDRPVWHIPLLSVQWIKSWWWTEEMSEICRVSWQNKVVKLVHLVGFITKKSVRRSHERKTRSKAYIMNSFILTFPFSCNINMWFYIYFICANIRTVMTVTCVARRPFFSFVHYSVWPPPPIILSHISNPWQISYNNIRTVMRVSYETCYLTSSIVLWNA